MKNIIKNYTLALFLTVLIIAAVIWILFGLWADSSKKTAEINFLENFRTELSKLNENDANIQHEYDEAVERFTEMSLMFPPSINQEETLRTVQELERTSGLEITGMRYEKLQYDTHNQTDGEKSVKPGATPLPGKGMKIPVTVNFTGSYNELKNFDTGLKETEQRIGIREMQVSTDRSRSNRGKMVLEFYGFAPETTPTPTTTPEPTATTAPD